MKKIGLIIFIFLALIEVSSCTLISETFKHETPIDWWNSTFENLDLPNTLIQEYYYKQPSFHGEGTTYCVYNVNEDAASEISSYEYLDDKKYEKNILELYSRLLNLEEPVEIPTEYQLPIDEEYKYFYRANVDREDVENHILICRGIIFVLYFESLSKLFILESGNWHHLSI